MSWAAEEFRDLDLGDKRRDARAVLLADRPTASLPGACAGWAETQGAYRLFRRNTFEWLDLNGQQIQGLGPLSDETQRGMYLHPTLAVSPEREPLGLLDAWMWAREPKDEDGTRPGEKESTRWVEGYERVAELSEQLPQTRLVYAVGSRPCSSRPLSALRRHSCCS